MTRGQDLVSGVLRTPSDATDFDMSQWSRLIGQARNADLLGQLRYVLDSAGILDTAPAPARRHLDIAWQLSRRHREAVLWELQHIQHALAPLEVRVVVLKGAAYCLTGARAAHGRVFNDVDILVPAARLAECEDALISRGWVPELTHAYDQRYYREWMHELPPLQHKDRATVLDVHHTIVPPVSGIVPDAQALIEHACPVPESAGLPGFYALAPEDMVLHSACHLFFNEFHKGLRDLYDLHVLFEEFGGQEAFWSRLNERARECELARPLIDAMQHCQRVFGTRISAECLSALIQGQGSPRFGRIRRWMLREVLRPDHPSCSDAAIKRARWLAYARSHWLRMPLHLLAYHLVCKALRRSS